eukprot:9508036-Lingulodinium_polyedra.AAC.1
MKVPVIFRQSNYASDFPKLASTGDDFAKKFANSADRGTVGRMQRKIATEASDEAERLFQQVLPDDAIQGDGLGLLSKEVITTFFAVALKTETCSVEYNHFGTLRFGLKGTREMVTVSLLDL